MIVFVATFIAILLPKNASRPANKQMSVQQYGFIKLQFRRNIR